MEEPFVQTLGQRRPFQPQSIEQFNPGQEECAAAAVLQKSSPVHAVHLGFLLLLVEKRF
jgi:hypothetical protein